MRSTLTQIGSFALTLTMATWMVGCDDSCLELSKEVCRCESTQSSQSACLQRLDTRTSGRDANPEEIERCNDLLDTCSCDALAVGDYEACGLSEE
ncbi:MAG: hypothetical protein AAFZ38_07825 [Myxococcota bacterium]